MVPPAVCARLAECYGDDLDAHVPRREPLEVDALTASGGEDETLVNFVHLVRRLRHAEPGEPLPLRGADVAALASALDADPEEIEHRIMYVLGCSRDEARTLHRALLRRKVVLPVVGLAASVVAIAGVQAAHAASDRPARPTRTPSEAPAAQTDGIATAPATTAAPRTSTTTAAPHTSVTTTTTHPASGSGTLQTADVVPPPAPAGVPDPPPGGWYPLPDTPPTSSVTPPSIQPDDTPVSVLPGETPITDTGTAISTVPEK